MAKEIYEPHAGLNLIPDAIARLGTLRMDATSRSFQ
jgi:hypothetical protein